MLLNTALESLSAAIVETKNIKVILVANPSFCVNCHPSTSEIIQLFFQKKSLFKMKLLQFNITSLNTCLEELCCYQKENYDAIFLLGTNCTEGKSLAYFKHWKTRTFTNFRNKATGFGVGTLVSSAQKNVFRDELSRKDLEIISNKIQIQGEKTYVGNIYILPGNENHLHILDTELEKHKGENILLTGDFNNRNKIRGRNASNN